MVGRQFEFHDGEKGAALAVRVKLGKGASSFSKVLRDGTVVIRLEQREGDVNARLIDFLSSELDIHKKRLQIVAGENGNNKLISILDMKPVQIQTKILERMP
ncbi:MAG: hypothetical protein DRI65_00185 [Chloroflexota bacterium]|nr:MAG: hypothetical protein DRI65_00185 [Chloroflexota bacterium]